MLLKSKYGELEEFIKFLLWVIFGVVIILGVYFIIRRLTSI